MNQHRFFSLFVPLVLILILFISCTRDNLDDFKADPGAGVPCDTSYAFSGNISSIINTYCAIPTCHVQNFPNGDFSIYSGVKAKINAGVFQTRVFVNKDMPPSVSPGPTVITSCELAILEKWVADGAPN